MAKVEITKYYDINDILTGAQEGMLEFAGDVRANMRMLVPLGIGTLRDSFRITGPFVQLDSMTVSIETPIKYAEIQNESILRHMPYQGRAEGGQLSFMERAEGRGYNTRMKKYRRGYYLTARAHLYGTTRYKSLYVERAMEESGGEDEMINKIDKSMIRYLEVNNG